MRIKGSQVSMKPCLEAPAVRSPQVLSRGWWRGQLLEEVSAHGGLTASPESEYTLDRASPAYNGLWGSQCGSFRATCYVVSNRPSILASPALQGNACV